LAFSKKINRHPWDSFHAGRKTSLLILSDVTKLKPLTVACLAAQRLRTVQSNISHMRM